MAKAVLALAKLVRDLTHSVHEVRDICLASLQAQQAAANAGDKNATIGFFSIQDMAGMFRVHRKTIERWVKHDGMPCMQVGGVRRFNLGDVLRWAATHKRGGV